MQDTACKCIGGKYGYCDLCTHAHMVEACCADLRRPAVAPRETQQQPLEELAKQEMSPFERDYFSAPNAPATQHRVIPVEWHRVAVEPARKMPISGGGHVVDPEEDNAPARVEPTCEMCGAYNGHRMTCSRLDAMLEQITPSAQPANTDDRQADTIPDDLKRRHTELNAWINGPLPAGMEMPAECGNRYELWLIERTGRAETRIEVLEAALHRIYSWCEAYPLEVFPAPDLQRDRELLGDAEFTRLNAHSMRHVVEGIKKIAARLAPSGEKEKI